MKFAPRLNRTFYGIETTVMVVYLLPHLVLIVPFMELKRNNFITRSL